MAVHRVIGQFDLLKGQRLLGHPLVTCGRRIWMHVDPLARRNQLLVRFSSYDPAAVVEFIPGKMDGWIDGCINGWVDGWVDG